MKYKYFVIHRKTKEILWSGTNFAMLTTMLSNWNRDKEGFTIDITNIEIKTEDIE